jgi:hypothetical protein
MLILGMLGSDQSGERDAAALAAMRLLHEHHLTWPDVLSAAAVAAAEKSAQR